MAAISSGVSTCIAEEGIGWNGTNGWKGWKNGNCLYGWIGWNGWNGWKVWKVWNCWNGRWRGSLRIRGWCLCKSDGLQYMWYVRLIECFYKVTHVGRYVMSARLPQFWKDEKKYLIDTHLQVNDEHQLWNRKLKLPNILKPCPKDSFYGNYSQFHTRATQWGSLIDISNTRWAGYAFPFIHTYNTLYLLPIGVQLPQSSTLHDPVTRLFSLGILDCKFSISVIALSLCASYCNSGTLFWCRNT